MMLGKLMKVGREGRECGELGEQEKGEQEEQENTMLKCTDAASCDAAFGIVLVSGLARAN